MDIFCPSSALATNPRRDRALRRVGGQGGLFERKLVLSG
jgi:hypothetical protein